jgi:hypothetical protein
MDFVMPDAVKNQSEDRNDIEIPIIREILAAFMLAKNDPNRPDGVGCKPDDLIFPGCINNPTRAALSERGHRRSPSRHSATATCRTSHR